MKTFSPLLAAAGLTTAALYHLWSQPQQTNGVAAIDPSASLVRNCPAFAQGAKNWISDKPGIREGSTLTVLTMGRDAINPEPAHVMTAWIPIEDGTVIGGDKEAYRASQQKLFADVEGACEKAKAGRQSPVYQMVRRAIDLVRGADGKGHGYVLLKSDLDDDAHPLLSAVLRQAVRDLSITPPEVLLGSLDNANVAIHVCGTAELAARKGNTPAASLDARLRIWRSLLTHPQLLTMQPFCGT